MRRVILEEIRDAAIRIAIRLALGEYRICGPQANILELESRVAWATVATELHNEGYAMISPEELAAAGGQPPAAVIAGIERKGDLFALCYAARGETFLLVSLPEREERDQLGSMPV